MSLSVFQQLISNTIVLGSLYALVGMGFVILFRSTGVVNFAQGSFMVLAPYILYSLSTGLHLEFWIAFVASSFTVAAVGAAVYVGFLHRLTGADLFVTVIATLGLSVVLQTATSMIWGPNDRVLPLFFSNSVFFTVLGLQFTRVDIIAIATSAALMVGFELLLQRTVVGIQTRAVADSTHLAALVRVRVHAVSALAWAVSALCAAVAGVAVALQVGTVDPVSISQLGLLVFPIVIIGGVDSIRGAMIGGLLVAAIQNVGLQYLGGNWVDPLAYGTLLLTLLVRPNGLFGSRAIIRI